MARWSIGMRIPSKMTGSRGRRHAPARGAFARLLPAMAISLLMLNLSLAETSANSVATRRVGLMQVTTTAERLKPSECSALTLTTILRGTTSITGTSPAELILAGTGIDNIDGRAGNDCILGGAGNDVINGGAGTDVCIGGPGTDIFTNCETEIQ